MLSERQEEFQTKLNLVRGLFDSQQVNAILISDQHGFAWMTCGGDSHVALSGDRGSASILVTEDQAYLICSNVERRRILEEEVVGLPLEVHTYNWYDSSDREPLQEILGGASFGSDLPRGDAKPVGSALEKLRYTLLEPEVERLKWLGREAESAMRQTCQEAERGESEFELAGRLASACYSRKMLPLVLLVAVDDRIERIRHPIPTDKEIEQTAMLVVCARRWGLYACLTRLFSFDGPDAELRRRHQAVTRIDATMIAFSRVGNPYSEIFKKAVKTYEELGFPEDWKGLHLGGATGYAGRYFKANPNCREVIQDSQAIAWNPAINGTKSEDTILVSETAINILTEARDWPKIEHRIGDLVIPRPDILVR